MILNQSDVGKLLGLADRALREPDDEGFCVDCGGTVLFGANDEPPPLCQDCANELLVKLAGAVVNVFAKSRAP